MLRRYKQFESLYSGTTATVILKEVNSSQRAVLYSFNIGGVSETLWIPKKAIYNTIEHKLSISKDYKIVVIGSFIVDQNEDFFGKYERHMLPVIKRVENQMRIEKDNLMIEDFRKIIEQMIPGIDNLIYNTDSNTIETNLGDFYIYKRNPLMFKVGDILIEKNKGKLYLSYSNDFTIEIKGKNGLVAKALIKDNSDQKLDSIELMALKTIYNTYEKDHNQHYRQASSNYKSDKSEASLIGIISKVLQKYNKL
jgi:hypothetical protein